MSPTFRPPDQVAAPVARFDARVDALFDQLRGRPVIDRIYYGASELGDFGLVWLLAGGIQAVREPDPLLGFARFAALMGLESTLVNGGIKSLFRRTRPVHDGVRPHHLRQPRTSSFPSGHASSAFLAASLLSDRSRVAPLWYAAAIVVATSRIHVRIHHASDVVVGMGIGAAMGLAIRRLWPRAE